MQGETKCFISVKRLFWRHRSRLEEHTNISLLECYEDMKWIELTQYRVQYRLLHRCVVPSGIITGNYIIS
jgi:hypothetical protein